MTYIAKKYFNNYNILKFGDSQKNLEIKKLCTFSRFINNNVHVCPYG